MDTFNEDIYGQGGVEGEVYSCQELWILDFLVMSDQ